MKGVSSMSDQRIFDMELVKVESLEKAVKTPFYQTDSTGGSIWVIKAGQTLPKHYHHHSDDIWVILQGNGVFYPTPDTEVTFTKGQVIVSKKGECHGAKNTQQFFGSLQFQILLIEGGSESGMLLEELAERRVADAQFLRNLLTVNSHDRILLEFNVN